MTNTELIILLLNFIVQPYRKTDCKLIIIICYMPFLRNNHTNCLHNYQENEGTKKIEDVCKCPVKDDTTITEETTKEQKKILIDTQKLIETITADNNLGAKRGQGESKVGPKMIDNNVSF